MTLSKQLKVFIFTVVTHLDSERVNIVNRIVSNSADIIYIKSLICLNLLPSKYNFYLIEINFLITRWKYNFLCNDFLYNYFLGKQVNTLSFVSISWQTIFFLEILKRMLPNIYKILKIVSMSLYAYWCV